MPKGGYRPNGGRPKGAKSSKVPAQTVAALRQQPIEFLLDLMNDPSVPAEVRLRAAGIAAPFVHAKPAAIGKKQQAEIDARQASEWDRLLPDYGAAAPPSSTSAEEWDDLLNRPPTGSRN